MIKFLLVLLSIIFLPSILFAFPDEEKALLDFDLITSQAKQMILSSNNRYLYVGFNDQVKIVDLAAWDLADTQPYDFGSNPDYDGIVGGLELSNSRLYVSQDNGNMLYFALSDIAAEPTLITVKEETELGKMAINAAKTRLYVLDLADNNLLAYDMVTAEAYSISLPDDQINPTNFDVTDLLLVRSVTGGADYLYIPTTKGAMFYVVDGETVSNKVMVAANTKNLASVAVRANKESLYVVNSTDNTLLERSMTTLGSIDEIEILVNESGVKKTYNTSLTGVASSNSNIEKSTYTYVSGIKGMSVLDTNNVLQKIDPSSTDKWAPINTGGRYGSMLSSSDGYIYMSNEGGTISVITDNPWVEIKSIEYSGGGSSMSAGDTATITFNSDVDGTYSVKVGGNIDGSGENLVDGSGSSTGPVTAGEDATFAFAYNDNSGNLLEGDNAVFVFVTDGSTRQGRDMDDIVVDNPPPAVAVNNVGFGDTRLYLNFDRLTVNDMSYYNVYVSTDPDAVIGKTVTPVEVSQPSSGKTVTAEISDLTNGDLYYFSIEGVDDGGNVGPLTFTYADGSRVTGVPEFTVGPVELMGEKGCSVVPHVRGSAVSQLFIVLFIITAILAARLRFRNLLLLIFFGLMVSNIASAEEASPQWWTTELKGGFWMPLDGTMKKFFEPCCNMTAFIEQGFLYDSKYGAEVGIGFLSENGTAVGATSGVKSGDRFNLFLLPMETNFAFRADFKENQIIVPYVKLGIDYVYFRENLKGKVTDGFKFGFHTVGGIQILLDAIDKGAQHALEEEMGINDLYFTLDARYSLINNFGGKGLDLSSLIFSFGLLFEY